MRKKGSRTKMMKTRSTTQHVATQKENNRLVIFYDSNIVPFVFCINIVQDDFCPVFVSSLCVSVTPKDVFYLCFQFYDIVSFQREWRWLFLSGGYELGLFTVRRQ